MHTRPGGYLLLLTGHIVSTFGSSIYVVTLVLYLAQATDSAQALGLVQFLSYLPAALLGPLAGALVDRWNRKRVIIWADVVRGTLMIAAAAAGIALGFIPVWVLMLVTMATSLAGVFFVPAVHSIMPDLVSSTRLKRANGTRSAGTQLANLAGSAVGGVVYLLLGAPLVILANGITFVVSGISECFIRPARQYESKHRNTGRTGLRSIIRHTGEGFRFLAHNGGVRSLVIVAALMNLLLPPLVVSLPFVITDIWGLSPDFFGFLFAAVLAGGVLGFTAFGGPRTTADRERRIYASGPIVLSAVVFGLGVATMPGVASAAGLVPALFVLMLFAGAAIAVMHMIGVTRIQQSVAPTMRGRVFAALETVTSALLPAAYLASGLLTEAFRTRPHVIYFLVGLAALALSVFVLLNRPLRLALRSPDYS